MAVSEQFSSFHLEADGPVAHIQLRGPDSHNALTPSFYRELPAAVRRLDAQGKTRALVISSTGKNFTSGMDLAVFRRGDAIRCESPVDREELRGLVLSLQESFSVLERARFPVIAAVQGGCIGAGVDMICACDLRYATADAYFVIQEINLGIMADLGTLQRLPGLIPAGVARELAFTGEKLLAPRAQALGLVNEILPSPAEVIAHALAVAGKIARQSPLAVAATKESINYARDHGVEDSLKRAADWQAAIFDAGQILESFQSRKEAREPLYPELKPARSGLD